MLTVKDRDRIEMLRNKAVEPVIETEEFYYYFFKHMYEHKEDGSFEQQYVNAYQYAFENLSLVIDEGELIVAKNRLPMSEDQKAESEVLKEYSKTIFPTQGQGAHMTVDYDLVLKKGLTGIISTIEEKLASTDEESKRVFYITCKGCLEALIGYAQRYSDYAKALAEQEQDKARQAELFKIAEVCGNVPKNPAGSFYEAVQSVHFITHCISLDPFTHFEGHLLYQLGHPDRYLYEYYEHDLKAGILGPGTAGLSCHPDQPSFS